jgi:hypothetical protein
VGSWAKPLRSADRSAFPSIFAEDPVRMTVRTVLVFTSNENARSDCGHLSLYFKRSKFDEVKRHISGEMLLCQFQI